MRIAIVAVDGSLLSAIAGLSDLFWMTNQMLNTLPVSSVGHSSNLSQPRFETIIVSADGKSLRDPQGRLIPVDHSFGEGLKYDAALVAGMALGPDGLPPGAPSITEAAAWFTQQHRQSVLIGAACAGTFVLGEAGLLDHRRCTTTWWLHHAFKRKFPKARTVWGTAIEEQDNIVTTGGPLSWVDLALHIIKHFAGADVAKMVADFSVTDSQPLPQMVYAPRGFMNTSDPLLLKAEQIIRHNHPQLTATGLAKAVNLSERTLHRRLKDLTNESPKQFITRVRIETACVLLETPGASIKQIALQCGYTEETAFRRAFTKLIGMTPVDYKRWSSARYGGQHALS